LSPEPAEANPLDVWRFAETPDGKVYYINTETNVTTWDPPAGWRNQ